MAELVFGNVPHPAFIDRYIPDSQTKAWNDLGPRVPFGTCQHTMVGTLWGTDGWFRYNPVTGRWPTGLTDYGVGGSTDGDYDGLILRWNDPRGRRSGWANGGSDGLEGDGIAFVRALGVNAINRNLVSIERSDGGNIATPMSPKQFESLCQLHAYWADQARIPYTIYPLNPNVGGSQYPSGLIMYLEHREFAIKGCPYAAVMDQILKMHMRIKEILKQYQGTATSTPVPDPTPVDEHVWPNGWLTADLDERFGEIIVIDLTQGLDGMVAKESGFHPKGVVSNAWVQRCVDEGITKISSMPQPSHQTIVKAPDGTTSQLINFPIAGKSDWIAFKGDGNQGWLWLQ